MNDVRPGKKISLEDLLRIKRAERPPAEFWNRFESELRAKQLAAIVVKRRWWDFLPRGVAGLSRARIPLGAAAVLAVTVLGIREYRAPQPDNEVVLSSEPAVALVDRIATAETVPVVAHLVPVSAGEQPHAVGPVSREFAEASSVVAVAASGPAISSSSLVATLAEETQATEASFASLGAPSGFETRAVMARNSITEPLSQLSSPKNVRLRDRYLGGAFSAGYSIDSSAAPSVHVMERLRDRTLRPEEFSRFDARGDRLSIKL